MKYKNQLIKLLAFTFIFFSTSCSESFLDKGLLGELEDSDFMLTEADALAATNACYNSLREWRFNGGCPVLDIMSDESTKGSNPSDGIQVLDFDKFTFGPSTDIVTNWYITLFVPILRANLVITQIDNIQMDASLKERLKGEAKFIRGLAYFKLVALYGKAPIIEVTNPPRLLARNTLDESYAFIIKNFEDALQALPEQSEYPSTERGRVTKGAARGMLARTYLYKGDFVNAEKYAVEIINSGQYSLDPDFDHVFAQTGEFGTGSVYEIPALPMEFGDGGNQFAHTQGTRGDPNKGWGFNRPTVDLINSFEPGDPRMQGTILFVGEVIDNTLINGDGSTPDTTYDASGNIIAIECYNQKVWVPGSDIRASFGHNKRVIRYADILLIAAESMNENGKSNEALVHLNQVRARARGSNNAILPDITETNQASLRILIYRERHSEMAMEQSRYFDLIRTGRAAAVLGPLGFTANKNELFPIPQSEIDLSEGMLEQNPGW